MTIDQMRAAIVDVYPGRKWERKVEKMHDDQVVAVYNNLLRSGKFDKKETKRDAKRAKPNIRSDGYRAKQISMFDEE